MGNEKVELPCFRGLKISRIFHILCNWRSATLMLFKILYIATIFTFKMTSGINRFFFIEIMILQIRTHVPLAVKELNGSSHFFIAYSCSWSRKLFKTLQWHFFWLDTLWDISWDISWQSPHTLTWNVKYLVNYLFFDNVSIFLCMYVNKKYLKSHKKKLYLRRVYCSWIGNSF